MPKSVTFAEPSGVSRMFAGLTSRCRTPRSCACAERLGHLRHDPDAVEDGKGVGLGEPLREAPALDQLHGEIESPAVLADVEDRDDVWMLEASRDAGFLQEPRLRLLGVEAPVALVEPDRLQGELALDLGIAREVHDAHRPLSQGTQNLIATDSLRSHALRGPSERF